MEVFTSGNFYLTPFGPHTPLVATPSLPLAHSSHPTRAEVSETAPSGKRPQTGSEEEAEIPALPRILGSADSSAVHPQPPLMIVDQKSTDQYSYLRPSSHKTRCALIRVKVGAL